MEHKLKINREFFTHVLNGTKTFEIRKNDRNFCIGDIVFLYEWDNKKMQFTGRSIRGIITYITDFEQKEGYVVFSFEIN